MDLDRKTWRVRAENANREATFYPQEHERHPTDDPDTLPCIEVAGVQAYLYVDTEPRAVRLSVDLETANDWLLYEDGLVPVVVAISETVVFDATELTSASEVPDALVDQFTPKEIGCALRTLGELWRGADRDQDLSELQREVAERARLLRDAEDAEQAARLTET
jgi:hypothetical protein